MISLTIDIDPVPKPRPRFTRQGRAYTPAVYAKYEDALRSEFARIRTEMLAHGALAVSIGIWVVPPKKPRQRLPCVRPDLDNYVKGVWDAANGVLWKDDGQVIDLTAFKRYAHGRSVGAIHIQVQRIEEGESK